MTTTSFNEFEDLPEWVAAKVRLFRPKDAATWVFSSVPALENRSVMECMNAGEDGQNRVRRYLRDVMGRFFPDAEN